MAFIQRLASLRLPVATYAELPIADNILGDLRISTDTGDAYTWMSSSSTGSLSDWSKVTSASYSDLIGSPYSTALDIDNAVKVTTGLAINISLLAFNTLTGFGAALAKMFDGVVHQFNSEDTGLTKDECENYVQIDNTYYMPNKGDLDINTKMLIHGDGVQGSTEFVDLMRLKLYNHGAITDTTTKKFGTGSIKFDGASSCDLGRLVEGSASTMFATPMCLDFWLNAAAGSQPIMSNEAYVAEQYYQESYDAGEVIEIKKTADDKISATVLSTSQGMMGQDIVSIVAVSDTAITANTWNHIAVQRTAEGYVEIWINGVLDVTSDLFQVPSMGSFYPVVLTLGKLGSAYLTGYLDEIRLSDSVRYDAPFTPMTKAYNTATTPAPTPVIEDESGLDKVVTVYGNARMSGNNPLFGNASLYLDGIDSYLSLADSDDWQLCEEIESAGIDSYTKMLLHLDDSIVDEVGKEVTNNNVTFSSVTKKFGTHSAYFNGSNSSLVVPSSDDFNFGTGDFTLECWFNPSEPNYEGVNPLIIHKADASHGWQLQWNNTNYFYWLVYDAGYVTFCEAYAVLTPGTWYHLALTRENGVLRMFVDGVSKSVFYNVGNGTENIPSITADLKMGTNLGYATHGFIDEVRVSKGIARWTTNFTPSSEQYSSISLSDYTVDMWIDPLSLNDLDTYIIGQEDAWKLTLDGTSNKYLKFSVIGGNSIIAPVSLLLETWQHVAIVQNSGSVNLYINGILGARATGSLILNTAMDLTIGADSNGEHLFNGFIEEVRVSKGIARWTAPFNVPEVAYTTDADTKLLLPLNVQVVPNMVLKSEGFVANYVPTSARMVIFEEDIDVIEPNVDMLIEVSRDGGATFTQCIVAKDQEFGDGTLNLYTGSVNLSSQPQGELLVWKLTTQNNKDCRVRGISLNWR